MPLFFFLLTLTIRVLLPISSPLGPVPWLSLSSLHPFRQRQIRWGLAHCKAVSPNRPLTLKLTVRVRGWGSDMKGEWCCFPCSCSEGQHFKRDDPQTGWSQTFTGLTAKESRNLCMPKSPLHPEPLSWLFILSRPGVIWGYLTPMQWVKTGFVSLSSNPFQVQRWSLWVRVLHYNSAHCWGVSRKVPLWKHYFTSPLFSDLCQCLIN